LIPGDGDGQGDGGQSGGNGNTSGGDGDNSAPGQGLPCELQPVIAAKCQTCHAATPMFGAPMSLVTYDDFMKPAPNDPTKKVYQLAQELINSTDTNERMPQVGSPQLTTDELTAFNNWLSAGAPANTDSCSPGGGGGDGGVAGGDGDGGAAGGGGDGDDAPFCPNGNCTIDTTGLDCYKFTAYSKTGDKTKPFELGAQQDKYYTFGFPFPWTGTAYGIVIKPIIASNGIHHWLLYDENTGTVPTTPQASSGAHSSGDLVYGWAPGGDAVDFRKQLDGNIGFEFQAGHFFTIEFHFNSTDPSTVDASGLELCVQKTAPAHIAGTHWLGNDTIPNSVHTQGTCTPTNTQPIQVLGISPHMHLKGKHMKAIHVSGSTTTVIHDEDFAFANQSWYKRNFIVQPGDSITVRCDYTAKANFGTKTTDEMCYMFTMAYPKGALVNGGLSVHGGDSCLGTLFEGEACGEYGQCIQ
jgi:hypothetical protein